MEWCNLLHPPLSPELTCEFFYFILFYFMYIIWVISLFRLLTNCVLYNIIYLFLQFCVSAETKILELMIWVNWIKPFFSILMDKLTHQKFKTKNVSFIFWNILKFFFFPNPNSNWKRGIPWVSLLEILFGVTPKSWSAESYLQHNSTCFDQILSSEK